MLADSVHKSNLIARHNLEIAPHLQRLPTSHILGEHLQFYFELSTEIPVILKKIGLPSFLTQHRGLLGQAFNYFIHCILKDSNMSKWQTLSYLSTYSLKALEMHLPNYYVLKKQKHGYCSTKEIL